MAIALNAYAFATGAYGPEWWESGTDRNQASGLPTQTDSRAASRPLHSRDLLFDLRTSLRHDVRPDYEPTQPQWALTAPAYVAAAPARSLQPTAVPTVAQWVEPIFLGSVRPRAPSPLAA